MDTFISHSMTDPTDDAGFASPASVLHAVSLPRLALHVTRACHLPTSEYLQLCNLIQYDPALLIRYLFALQTPAAELKQGTISARLQQGNKALLSRTLLCADRFEQQFTPDMWNVAERFLLAHWLESIECAFLSRAFARALDLPNCDEIFFAGLLYRCGELALLAQEKQDYLRLIQQAGNAAQRQQLELFQYHTDHFSVSQKILKQLGMSHAYCDAALYYGMPSASVVTAHPVTRIIHVAHLIASGQVKRYGDASRLVHQVLDTEMQHVEVLVESALNQSQEIQELLGVHIEPELVRQQLLPPLLPADQITPLASDIEQFRVETTYVKKILSAATILEQAADMGALQDNIQRTAFLLFGCRRIWLFRFQPQQDALQGENSSSQGAFENLLRLSLAEASLPTNCFRNQRAIASFANDGKPAALVDLELIQLSGCKSLVALPLTCENRRWGCMVMAFEPDIQNRFNMLHKPLLFFAQQAQSALEQRDERMQWQQELAQFERKLFEHRIKRIAHEVNNPLSIAQNHLHIIQMNDGIAQELQDHVETAIEQIDCGSRILFASIERVEGTGTALAKVSVNELIQDVLYLFSSQNDKDLEFKTDLDETVPTLYIDENYLRQVLINLIKNAVECGEDGDTVLISTHAQVNINGRHHIAIQIVDDGAGIPEVVMDSLFQAQSSAKDGRRGGIGLMIVKDLVEEMGGIISFQRGKDSLSTFTLYLPA